MVRLSNELPNFQTRGKGLGWRDLVNVTETCKMLLRMVKVDEK